MRSYTDEALAHAVQFSYSIAQVLKQLHLSPTGCNYQSIQRHFIRLRLDTSHFTGQGHLKGKTHSWTDSAKRDEVRISL